MDELTFRHMCNDSGMQNRFDLQGIDLKKLNQNIESRVSEQYIASTMQTCFLKASDTTVEEMIVLEGGYSRENIQEAAKQIIREQSVLRSFYQEKQGGHLIFEYEYDGSFYVPYIDLRYASPEFFNNVQDIMLGMRNDKFVTSGKNVLSKIAIVRRSEKQHVIHIFVHHSVWDKISTQIFKERILNLLNGKPGPSLL
ncbi:UNVERIFIED_CONTAM: hypothetical protein ABIC26_004538 [Paenibacillus sp. PvR008]